MCLPPPLFSAANANPSIPQTTSNTNSKQFAISRTAWRCYLTQCDGWECIGANKYLLPDSRRLFLRVSHWNLQQFAIISQMDRWGLIPLRQFHEHQVSIQFHLPSDHQIYQRLWVSYHNHTISWYPACFVTPSNPLRCLDVAEGLQFASEDGASWAAQQTMPRTCGEELVLHLGATSVTNKNIKQQITTISKKNKELQTILKQNNRK